MTWARRFFNLMQSTGPVELNEELLRIHHGLLARGDSLGRTAALSPPPASEAELIRLAEREIQMAHKLAEVLRERDITIPPFTPGARQSGGLNHWARLVHDLEEHQAARNQVRHATTWIPDIDADINPLLRELGHVLDQILQGLRLLIARADPQALN